MKISSRFWNWHSSIVNWTAMFVLILIMLKIPTHYNTSHSVYIFRMLTNSITTITFSILSTPINQTVCFRLPSRWLLSFHLVYHDFCNDNGNSCTRIATVCKIIDRFDQCRFVARSNEWIFFPPKIDLKINALWLFQKQNFVFTLQYFIWK